MKNKMKLIVTTTLVIFLLGGFTNEKNVNNGVGDFKNHFTIDNQIIVKGMLVDGKVYPSYELPEVTITAERGTAFFTTAKVVDGKVVPYITLEEVVITPDLN